MKSLIRTMDIFQSGLPEMQGADEPTILAHPSTLL